MEEDPLAVSTSISVKLESNFERPQFDLTVSSNEGKFVNIQSFCTSMFIKSSVCLSKFCLSLKQTNKVVKL